MKFAVLDLGTNTFHLMLVSVLPDGSHEVFLRDRRVVELLEGSTGNDRISPEPFARGAKALWDFSEKIKHNGVNQVFAYGTSGIRSAQNGSAFVEHVKQICGININVISGEEEAALIHLGVTSTTNIGDRDVVILDIGGGSNEFIICNQHRIHWKHSFNLGAARMLNFLQPSDPIKPSEVQKLEAHFEDTMLPLFEAVAKYPVQTLVGASGSFDTFTDLRSSLGIRGSTPTGELNIEQFQTIHNYLIHSTLHKRLLTKGLVKFRADMIVVASVFTNFVVQRLGIEKIVHAQGALKEGAVEKCKRQMTNNKFQEQ